MLLGKILSTDYITAYYRLTRQDSFVTIKKINLFPREKNND